MKKFISEVLLIIVTIVWGLAFIWQNIASKVLGPLTVVGIRSVIAVIFIILSAVLMPALYKSQDPKNLAMKVSKKKEWILGIICGIVLFVSMYISQVGVGILSSGVGYTLQIVGQKNVPPHTASLILSLESIVAVIGGVLILNEHVGVREGIGMLIVFAGIIISQVPDKKQIEK